MDEFHCKASTVHGMMIDDDGSIVIVRMTAMTGKIKTSYAEGHLLNIH